MKLIEDLRKSNVGVLTVVREDRRVALPLAKYDVRARIEDRVADVTVTQAFTNPYAEPLEAVYLFPLRGGCAVRHFEMKVGDRVIQGKVKERGEARAQYQKALQQGKRAALLEQERDDVFTMQVGNIPPNETVEVRLIYSERLPFFEDGRTEMRIPLVVPPRYIPGQPLDRDSVGDGVEIDTDQVPDASRITPPRLAKGFDPQVALGIEVEIGDVDDLECSQHATRLSSGRISLAKKNELLNRDFVLRWRLAGEKLRTNALVHNGVAMLSILPPKRDGFLGLPRDVIFIVDRSGSMEGVKMTSAARACSILLGTLGPRDRFAIQAFDDAQEWFAPGFTPADEDGIERGARYLRGITSRGGTEMDGALAAALKLPQEPGRSPVIVLITDGQVGNESEILKRAQKGIGDARIFTIGVDTAVNEGFLKRLAAAAGGTSTFVVPGDALEEALCAIGREIGDPLVTDVRIEGAEDVTPSRVPDLFAGRATTVFFRAKGGRVRVCGKYADGKTFEESVPVREVDLPAIPQLWARSRVVDLEDRFRVGEADVREEIVKLAVEHRLLTRFTAYVAVDESEIVNPQGDLRRIVQPVEAPESWDMCMEEAEADAAPMRSMAMGAMKCSMPMPCSAPPPKEEAKTKKDAKPKVDPKERKKIEEAIEAFAKVLKSNPTADQLEKARRALLDAIAGQPRPALQKFLRTAAVELVAALRAGGDVRDLFARHLRAFDEARKEKEFWLESV